MTADLSFFGLIGNAAFTVQCIMLLLLAASVFSWAIIFARWQVLKKAQAQLQALERRFGLVPEWERLLEYLSQKREAVSAMEHIYRTGLKEYTRLRAQESMTPALIVEGTQRSMQTALAREERYLEEHLSFLATIGSLSVYVGLFGTVWGIMNAFRALGTVQQATLAMVAPGISEALIATAMGLFVAIPAVYFYNRLSYRLQYLMQSYDLLVEDFIQSVYRRLQSDRESGLKKAAEESIL